MSDDSDIDNFSMEDDDEDDVLDMDQDSVSDVESGDDNGDFGFDDEMANSKTFDKKPYDVDYKVKSPEDLRKAMESEVDKVRGIFDMDAQTATLLLRSFNWNREKLIEKYMDSPDECLNAAGLDANPPSPVIASSSLPNPSHIHAASSFKEPARKSKRTAGRSSLSSAPTSSHSSSTNLLKSTLSKTSSAAPSPETFECPICCLEFDGEKIEQETLALACSHRACRDCWGTYLEGKIKAEGESVRIQCLEDGCGRVVSEKVVEGLVGDGVRERYHELLNRTYVDDNAALRWCPHPECVYAVECKQAPARVLNTIIPTVTCKCENEFCFGCGLAANHRPVVCKVAKVWLRKCSDDSETSNWISANTKECDKCHSTIEKNGGCNHMTCKKCKHEFCWVCMGPWQEHGTSWYNCNRYDEKESLTARDGQSKSRASLERYLHYYNRWANHELSAKLDQQLYAKTEKKMEEMQLTSDLTWIEVQFAKKAVDVLVLARMTLKWTYAMAFYLKRNNLTTLFEDNQSDLEQAVEALSELLEKPIEREGIPALRQQVTDKTVYVNKRHGIMLDDTLKEYLAGAWEFSIDLS